MSVKIWIKSVVFVLAGLGNAFAQEAAAQSTEETISTIKKIIDLVIETMVKYSFQVMAGIIILIAGWIVAGFVAKFVKRFLDKSKLDITVNKYIVSSSKLVVMLMAGLLALGKFGIEIAPIIAGLSVVGFATSFALQGPLSNYASGVVLIFTKPFKVGEIIEVQDVIGEVEDMSLARTALRTVDGTTIVIPNKHIIGEIIHNYSELKRLDIKVGVSYKSDVEKAIQIVKDILVKEKRLDKIDDIKVGIEEFGDSSINLCARLRCRQSDYWDTRFTINRAIFLEFKKQGIEIPFPQRDVHLFQAQG